MASAASPYLERNHRVREIPCVQASRLVLRSTRGHQRGTEQHAAEARQDVETPQDVCDLATVVGQGSVAGHAEVRDQVGCDITVVRDQEVHIVLEGEPDDEQVSDQGGDRRPPHGNDQTLLAPGGPDHWPISR